MIALEEERAGRLFVGRLQVGGGAGRAGDLDVFVDQDAVVHHLHEAGVGDFFAVLVKARGEENHVKGLPLAGLFGDVDARRMAFVALVFLLVPAFVDAAALDRSDNSKFT